MGGGNAMLGNALTVGGIAVLLFAGSTVLELRFQAKAADQVYETPHMILLQVTLAMILVLVGSAMSAGQLLPAHAKKECAERPLDVVTACSDFASFAHRGASLAKLRK